MTEKGKVFDWICLLLVALFLAGLMTFMFMSFENMAVNNDQLIHSSVKVDNSLISVNNALAKLINQEAKNDG